MNPQARYFAASVKQSVAHCYAVSPRKMADQAVAGALWEIADVLADEQGSREAAETLYRIADAVARRLPIEAVFPVPAQPSEEVAAVNEGLDSIIAAMRKTIEAHGAAVEKIEIVNELEPAQEQDKHEERGPRAFLTGCVESCQRHWLGLIFIAFYAGLTIGSAM